MSMFIRLDIAINTKGTLVDWAFGSIVFFIYFVAFIFTLEIYRHFIIHSRKNKIFLTDIIQL